MISSEKITFDPISLFEMPDAISEQLEALYAEMNSLNGIKKLDRVINKLRKFIKAHPAYPQSYNYLASAYNMQGEMEKAKEVNELLFDRFPDYLFGRVALVNGDFAEDFYEDVTYLLGEKLELDALYPDRDKFHIQEVAGYYMTVAQYFFLTEQTQRLEQLYEDMHRILPDEPTTMEIARLLGEATPAHDHEHPSFPHVHHHFERWPQTDQEPTFNFPEQMKQFYRLEEMDEQEWKAVMALDRELLIQDLIRLIEDGFVRFEHFQKIDEQDMVARAITMLTDLRYEGVWPYFPLIAMQDYDFIYFYFGDALPHFVKRYAALCKGLDLEKLEEFLMTPGIGGMVKSFMIPMVAFQVFHGHIERTEVEAWVLRLLNKLYDAKDDSQLCDGYLNSGLIGLATDLNMKDALPQVKKFFDDGLVDPNFSGDYEEVASYFEVEHPYTNYQPNLNGWEFLLNPLNINMDDFS